MSGVSRFHIQYDNSKYSKSPAMQLVIEERYKTMLWMKILRSHHRWKRYFFDDFIRFFVCTYIIPPNYTHVATTKGLLSVVGEMLVHRNKLFTVSDKCVRVYSTKTNALLATLSGHTKTVRCIAAGGNRIFTGGLDNTIRVWDVVHCTLLKTIEASPRWILYLIVREEENLLYSGSADGIITLWDIDVKGSSPYKSVTTFIGIGEELRNMMIYKDKLYSGHFVWNAFTGACIAKLPIGANSVYCMIAHEDRIYTAGQNSEIDVWTSDSQQRLTTLRGHTHQVYALAASEKRLYSGGADHSIRVWSTATHDSLAVLEGHTFWIYVLRVHHGRLLCGAADTTISVWDINTYKRIQVLRGHTSGVHSMAIDSDSLWTGGADWTFRRWICR